MRDKGHQAAQPQRSELENLALELSDISQRTRSGLSIMPVGSDKSFPIHVMGVVSAHNQLIVTAPATPDGGLIAVYKGQKLTCRWVNASSAFKFTTHIIRILFEPIPLLYLGIESEIQRRAVRSLPRALASLHAVVKTPAVNNALITDLSVGGSRVAVSADVQLEKSQEIELVAKPQMLGREFLLTLRCTVTGEINDGRNAARGLHYYGLRFDDPSEHDVLLLHAYVQQQLALESDGLTNLLQRICGSESEGALG